MSEQSARTVCSTAYATDKLGPHLMEVRDAGKDSLEETSPGRTPFSATFSTSCFVLFVGLIWFGF